MIAQPTVKSGQMQPGLYIVATPIGNLRDLTLRAIDTLTGADLILCEDTRVTAKLLAHYGIHKLTLSYNDHNAAERRPKVLKALAEGQRVALVSDAGTPLISDPGYKLVRTAIEQGSSIIPIPGPSSPLAALCVSGLPTNRFFFAGFLPAKKEASRKEIRALAAVPSTLIFFESARRLPDTLALLEEGLGNRDVAVARELTKLYEETRRAPLRELREFYEAQGAPKGEVIIIVGPPLAEAVKDIDIEARLKKLLAAMSVKEAAALLAEETGRPRKEMYSLALRIHAKD